MCEDWYKEGQNDPKPVEKGQNMTENPSKSSQTAFLPILRLNQALRPFGKRIELVHTTEGDLLGLCTVETGEVTDRPTETQLTAFQDALDVWASVFSDLDLEVYDLYDAHVA